MYSVTTLASIIRKLTSASIKKEHRLMVFLKALRKFSLRFPTGLALIGGVWLFLIMFQVVGDVTGRYIFLKPIPATYLLGEIMLVFLVFCGATYTEISGGHIRLLIINERFSPKWQALLDIIFLLGGLVILILLTWQTFGFAMRSWQFREVFFDYPIPIYPVKFIVSIGCFIFSIQYLLKLYTKIAYLARNRKSSL